VLGFQEGQGQRRWTKVSSELTRVVDEGMQLSGRTGTLLYMVSVGGEGCNVA
jgi:hypothetical protein